MADFQPIPFERSVRNALQHDSHKRFCCISGLQPPLMAEAVVVGTGTDGSGPVQAPGTQAAAQGQSWIAFVSDTHIAADPSKTNHNLNMTENLKKTVRQILAEAIPPKAVLIDGDLALADGQKGDYVQLMQLLAP